MKRNQDDDSADDLPCAEPCPAGQGHAARRCLCKRAGPAAESHGLGQAALSFATRATARSAVSASRRPTICSTSRMSNWSARPATSPRWPSTIRPWRTTSTGRWMPDASSPEVAGFGSIPIRALAPSPAARTKRPSPVCSARRDWAVMFILARGGQTYARLEFHVGPGGSCSCRSRWITAVLSRPAITSLAGRDVSGQRPDRRVAAELRRVSQLESDADRADRLVRTGRSVRSLGRTACGRTRRCLRRRP